MLESLDDDRIQASGHAGPDLAWADQSAAWTGALASGRGWPQPAGGLRGGGERPAGGEHRVQHGGQVADVGVWPDWLTRSPRRDSAFGQRGRPAEIGQGDRASRAEQHVARVDPAVDQPVLMGDSERLGQFDRDLDRPIGFPRSVLLQGCGQVLTVDPLADDVRHVDVAGRPASPLGRSLLDGGVVDASQGGVRHGAGRGCGREEGAGSGCPPATCGGQNLGGDAAGQYLVVGQPQFGRRLRVISSVGAGRWQGPHEAVAPSQQYVGSQHRGKHAAARRCHGPSSMLCDRPRSPMSGSLSVPESPGAVRPALGHPPGRPVTVLVAVVQSRSCGTFSMSNVGTLRRRRRVTAPVGSTAKLTVSMASPWLATDASAAS